MAIIGYARVSTEEQNLNLQRDALEAAGCEKIFEDLGCSAIAAIRPGFDAALAAIQAGDTFVIWKMDRAFRSLLQALETLEHLEACQVSFLSITDHIDTCTPMGRCMYQIRNAFAELERSLISERTKAGMEAARRRGQQIGRPRKLSTDQIEEARDELTQEGGRTLNDIAQEMHVSRRTLRRALDGG